jgi:hypothetical protein
MSASHCRYGTADDDSRRFTRDRNPKRRIEEDRGMIALRRTSTSTRNASLLFSVACGLGAVVACSNQITYSRIGVTEPDGGTGAGGAISPGVGGSGVGGAGEGGSGVAGAGDSDAGIDAPAGSGGMIGAGGMTGIGGAGTGGSGMGGMG